MSFQQGLGLSSLKKLVPPGSKWRHHKNPETTYVIHNVGFTTSSLQAVVIYGAKGSDDIWVRHHSEWFDQKGKQKRFTQVLEPKNE